VAESFKEEGPDEVWLKALHFGALHICPDAHNLRGIHRIVGERSFLQ